MGVRDTREEQTERVIAPPGRVVENVGFVVAEQHTWPATFNGSLAGELEGLEQPVLEKAWLTGRHA